MDVPTYGYGKSIGDAIRSIWDPKAEAEAENFRTTNEFNQLKLKEAKKTADEADEDKRLLADLISGKELQGPVQPGQAPLGRDASSAIFTPGEGGFAVGINREAAKNAVPQIISRLALRNPAQAQQLMSAWNKATLTGGVDGDFFTKLQAALVRSGETVQSVTTSPHIPLSPVQYETAKANTDARVKFEADAAAAAAERERIAKEQEWIRNHPGIAGIGVGGSPGWVPGSRLADLFSGTNSARPNDFSGVLLPKLPAPGANVTPSEPAVAPSQPGFMTPIAPAPAAAPAAAPGATPAATPAEAPAAAPTPPPEPAPAPISQEEANGGTPPESGSIAADMTGWKPVEGRPGVFVNSAGVISSGPKPLTPYQQEQVKLQQERLARQQREVQHAEADKVILEQRSHGANAGFNIGYNPPTSNTVMSPALRSQLESVWSDAYIQAVDGGATRQQAFKYATAITAQVVKYHYDPLKKGDRSTWKHEQPSQSSTWKDAPEVTIDHPETLDPNTAIKPGSELMIGKQDIDKSSDRDDKVEFGVELKPGVKITANDALKKLILAEGIIDAMENKGYLRMPDKDGKQQMGIRPNLNMAIEAQTTFLHLYAKLKEGGYAIPEDMEKAYQKINARSTPAR